jgi:hypothetical protein
MLSIPTNTDERAESSPPSSDDVFLDDSPACIYVPIQHAFRGLRAQRLTESRVTT